MRGRGIFKDRYVGCDDPANPELKKIQARRSQNERYPGQFRPEWGAALYRKVKQHRITRGCCKLPIMENTNTQDTRRRTLPRVAGAPSGANAGGDSLQRTVGGQELAGALAGLPEEETMQRGDMTTNPPVLSVLRTDVVPTTSAGLARQRIKWTATMNKAVMRAYFIATKMETNMTAYRSEMKRLFIAELPELQRLSEQNISDRRRAIVNRHLLTEVEINSTRIEAQNIIRGMELRAAHANYRVEVPEDESGAVQTDQEINVEAPGVDNFRQNGDLESSAELRTNEEEAENMAEVEQLRVIFNAAMLEFEDVEPRSRHIIPRLYPRNRVEKYTRLMNSHIMPQHLTANITLERLCCLIYISAVSITRIMKFKTRPRTVHENRAGRNMPHWEKRLAGRVENLRKDMGRLTEFINGTATKKLRKQVAKIIHPLSIDEITVQDVINMRDIKRQSLAAYAKRLARYRECRDRKIQNALFLRNEKSFYGKLEDTKGHQHDANRYPSMDEMTEYWSALWCHQKKYQKNDFIIQKEETENINLPGMEASTITVNDVKNAIAETKNWKAPGPDCLHNIWLKKLTCTHPYIAMCFTQLLLNPAQSPEFLTTGNTFLLPKKKEAYHPNQFRPITCLSTIYKLLTKIIADKIYMHCDNNSILTNEQKGCKKNTKGCKDQLTIDSIVVQQAIQKHKNLSMAYIDYRKAFDSMPHDYLIHILKIYKVDNNIINLMGHLMTKWNICLCNPYGMSSPISIRNGILQGDAFSPLWFCLGLNPLSRQLRKMRAELGFKIKYPEGQTLLNHLLYVDDIKLYAPNKEKLHRMIKIVSEFSQSISMSFGLDKCKIAHLVRGRIVKDSEGCVISDEEIIESLDDEDSYKYLGFLQLRGLDTKLIKAGIEKIFEKRMRKILKSKLNAGNKCKAINTWAIPVYNYSFGVIKWSPTDIDGISRNIRVLLTKYQSHHPRSATERVVIPRERGGRGILDIAELQEGQICKLREYFFGSANCEILDAITKADDDYTPLCLSRVQYLTPTNVRKKDELLTIWKAKQIHGKHPREMFKDEVDIAKSNLWLKKGKLFLETEGFLVAIQDGVIATRNYRRHILHESVPTDKCRRCNATTETIEHIICGCPMLAPTEYLERHNKVAKIIHKSLAKRYQILETNVPYYKYKPAPVVENRDAVLYWDRQVITDTAVVANKPDILLFDNKNKYIYIIDISIPLTENMQKAHSNKISKYSDLASELEQMYHITNIRVLPIIISATGVVPKSVISNLQIFEMEENIEEIQKAVILATCNIVRKFIK